MFLSPLAWEMLTTSTIQQRCMYIQIFGNLYISTIQHTNPTRSTNPTQSTNTDTDRYRTTALQAPALLSQALHHRLTGGARYTMSLEELHSCPTLPNLDYKGHRGSQVGRGNPSAVANTHVRIIKEASSYSGCLQSHYPT